MLSGPVSNSQSSPSSNREPNNLIAAIGRSILRFKTSKTMATFASQISNLSALTSALAQLSQILEVSKEPNDGSEGERVRLLVVGGLFPPLASHRGQISLFRPYRTFSCYQAPGTCKKKMRSPLLMHRRKGYQKLKARC